MNRSSPLVALLLLSAIACRSPAPAPPAAAQSDPRVAELRETCEQFRRERGIVGMAVAVLDHGRVVLDESLGLADRERDLPVDSATLFRLGSISKPVTATIAMQLVDEGRLDLDAELDPAVPALAGRLPDTTLRHVLSHTAGIRHYRMDRRDNTGDFKTTTEALDLFLGDPRLFDPGTKYSYSTHGYTVAVAALEHTTSETFVDLVRRRVRDRAARTLDCEVLAEEKPQRSALYELRGEAPAILATQREDNSWKYGGGGLESTALDLARFGEAVRTASIVSERGRDEMWKPAALADGSEAGYGLGWRYAADRGQIHHTGSQQGAHAVLAIVPTEGWVIAVMTNTLGGKPQELVPRLRELLSAALVNCRRYSRTRARSPRAQAR
ncbi:MAG: serine hydrolase domain-containing protein [Planctomycetota bacterium]